MSDCVFRAIIPNLQSAIQVAGDGGWRVKLDIPASEEARALELLALRGRVLIVSVKAEAERQESNEFEEYLRGLNG